MKGRSLKNGGGGGGCFSLVLFSLAAFLYVILFVESVEGKVRCYVCSWHSPAYGGKNMTDTCSHYHFDEMYTQTIECDGGCEAVSIRKSKNENVVNFYKNCKSASSQTKDECTSMEDDKFQYLTTCECSSDLCNSAENMRGRPMREAFSFVFAALIVRFTLTAVTK